MQTCNFGHKLLKVTGSAECACVFVDNTPVRTQPKCPTTYVWSSLDNRCIHESCKVNCPAGSTLKKNGNKCACIAKRKPCPKSYAFSKRRGRCIPQTCLTQCVFGFKLVRTKYRCKCMPKCDNAHYYDTKKQLCMHKSCKSTCPAGYKLGVRKWGCACDPIEQQIEVLP
jgi:hypothetical protein